MVYKKMCHVTRNVIGPVFTLYIMCSYTVQTIQLGKYIVCGIVIHTTIPFVYPIFSYFEGKKRAKRGNEWEWLKYLSLYRPLSFPSLSSRLSGYPLLPLFSLYCGSVSI